MSKEIKDLEISITEKNMVKFYKELDILKLKYSLTEPDPNNKKYRENYEKYVHDYAEYVERYAEIERIEDAFRLSELTKVEYGDILQNLDMIYADREKSDRIVELFDMIRSKIIAGYISIDGLERLFSEKYIDFEWDMHLGIDYKAHKMKFYRDHFVHQIRNAYCIHRLLDDFNWLNRIVNIMKNTEKSKISRYVEKCVTQQKVIGYYRGLEEYTEDDFFYYKNIIYMSCYMAALFHDIGYPEQANAVNQNRIIDYISNLYNAESSGYNDSRLRALLQNSLLFRLVPIDEIQRRISRENMEHGALSAIIFLLNFYENGVIQGLEPYKKCAVELAALAIYNHTNDYKYKNDIKEGEYIRNQFSLNPIAYILRICDDIQEWGRIYFELSNKSDMIICNQCKTPALRKKISSGRYHYVCNCCSEKNGKTALFSPMFDYDTNFPYRKIYNVTVCERLKIEDNKRGMCFDLDYRLDRLLNMSYINPNYARYRIKALNKLKKHLEYQPDLPIMRVRYFMTANPILIKIEILDKFFQNAFSDDIFNGTMLSELYSNMSKIGSTPGTEQERQKKIFWDNMDKVESACQKVVYNRVENIYSSDKSLLPVIENVKSTIALYTILTITMELYKRDNQDGMQQRIFLDHEVTANIKRREEELEIGASSDLGEILNDCFQQFRRMFLDITEKVPTPKVYFEQFDTSAYTYGCIRRFLSAERYEPICNRRHKEIDGYTDLALFQSILEEINNDD